MPKVMKRRYQSSDKIHLIHLARRTYVRPPGGNCKDTLCFWVQADKPKRLASRAQIPSWGLQVDFDVVVVGAGNAALCAALAANESGAKVLVLERAPQEETISGRS
jgi:threonine dehydrogenase-like Zn-dependent dehydrogenase